MTNVWLGLSILAVGLLFLYAVVRAEEEGARPLSKRAKLVTLGLVLTALVAVAIPVGLELYRAEACWVLDGNGDPEFYRDGILYPRPFLCPANP